MGSTAVALAGFAGWYLLLTVALGMYRSALIFGGQKAANSFAPDGSDVSPFGRRLNRARDNCYENLPLFAALASRPRSPERRPSPTRWRCRSSTRASANR